MIPLLDINNHSYSLSQLTKNVFILDPRSGLLSVFNVSTSSRKSFFLTTNDGDIFITGNGATAAPATYRDDEGVTRSCVTLILVLEPM